MQISAFKLSDFELESGFFDVKYTPTYSFYQSHPKVVEYMQHFLLLRFSILY